MDLKTANVIVTGGSSGIGYETAKLLRFHGAEVVICGRNEENIQQAAEELDVFAVQADVSNEADVQKLFAFAMEKLGGLNVLVNNAGIGFMGSLLETSAADFTRIWEINTRSAFLCGQLAAKHFVSQNTRQHHQYLFDGRGQRLCGRFGVCIKQIGDDGFNDVLAGGTSPTQHPRDADQSERSRHALYRKIGLHFRKSRTQVKRFGNRSGSYINAGVKRHRFCPGSEYLGNQPLIYIIFVRRMPSAFGIS